MFVKTRNYDKAIQKVRIEVDTYVGLEKDDEAFLILKELPTQDMLKLKDTNGGNTETLTFFKEVMPHIIVDHNFYETEQKKMKNEEVVEFIFEKFDLCTKVLSDYSNASFFTQRKGKEGK